MKKKNIGQETQPPGPLSENPAITTADVPKTAPMMYRKKETHSEGALHNHHNAHTPPNMMIQIMDAVLYCPASLWPSSGCYYEQQALLYSYRKMVPEKGIEPSLPCEKRILNPPRLPIPPLRHRGEDAL